MNPEHTSSTIAFSAIGAVNACAQQYATELVSTSVGLVPVTAGPIRLRLTWLNPADVARPAIAQVVTDTNAGLVRAQVAAATLSEASQRVAARIARQLLASAVPSPRPWPEDRPRPELCAPRLGRVIRRKTVLLHRCTPHDAALQMDVRDYDFHLFIDAETGAESVVSRVGPTGYRLTRLAGQGPIIADGDCFAAPITVDVHPVPTRTVTQMARRLEIAALGYRFFCDAHTSKAAVLYRRYDGQLGLVCGEPR